MCVRTECRIKIFHFCVIRIAMKSVCDCVSGCSSGVLGGFGAQLRAKENLTQQLVNIISRYYYLHAHCLRHPVARVASLKRMCAHTAHWLKIIWSESCIVWQRSAQPGTQWPCWSPTKWYLHLFISLVFEIETFLVRLNIGLPSCLSRSNTMDLGHWNAGENDFRSIHGTVFTRRWSSLKYNCTYFFLVPHNHQTMANENYIYIQSRTRAVRRRELEK